MAAPNKVKNTLLERFPVNMLSKPFYIVLIVYDSTIIRGVTGQVKPTTVGEVNGSQRKPAQNSFNIAQSQIGLDWTV
jgi:hypothetical protein